MLALFSFASIVAFAVVGALVGWRIRGLARTTGGAPERWIALCLLAICGVGYPGLILAQMLPWMLPIAALSIGIAGVNVGIGAIFYFTRSVFRPEVRWLSRALPLVVAGLVFHWIGASIDSSRAFLAGEANPALGSWTVLIAAISSVGFGWTACESLRYWAILRKRLLLGLADPLVVNRVALWGATGVSSFLINAVNAWTAYADVNVLADPFTMVTTGVLGMANAGCLWLAFLPPESYAARIRQGVPPQA